MGKLADECECGEMSLNLATQVKEKVQILQKFKKQWMDAESALALAKKNYMDYAKSLADEFHLNGITSIGSDDGRIYSLKMNTTCSINKNKTDKMNVINWLRAQGAEHLVTHYYEVPASQQEKLQQYGIINEEITDCNTNAVKSFVLGALGQKDIPATITIDDLPKGLNFFQFESVEEV